MFIACNNLQDFGADIKEAPVADGLVIFDEQPEDFSVFLYDVDATEITPLKVKVKVTQGGNLFFVWYKVRFDGTKQQIGETTTIKNVTKGSSYEDECAINLSDFSGNSLFAIKYWCEVSLEANNETYNFESKSCIGTKRLPDMDLMTLNITTVDGKNPTCRYLYDELGKFVTVDQEKIQGRLSITRNGVNLYDSGEYEQKKSGITIKIRGNGSAYSDKKPYKIKLQKKDDLLFRGDKKYKDKNWNLTKCNNLNTVFGLLVTNTIYTGWVPEYEFVNVILNDEYLGLYLLIESIDYNTDCRMNVENDGFIVERDSYARYEVLYDTIGDAPLVFYTATGKSFSYKFPDDDDVTDESLQYTKQCLDEMENAISLGTYDDVIDVTSWSQWLLVQDIIGQKDVGGANRYYSKYNREIESLIKMETPWDFDQIMYNKNEWITLHETDIISYFSILCKSTNNAFITEYKNQWNLIESTIEEDLKTNLRVFCSEYGESIDLASKLDSKRWNTGFVYVETKLQSVINWIEDRVSFIKNNITEL